MKRIVLLNPGPVNVTESVRDAMSRGDMCHREKEITDLIWGIRQKLLDAFSIRDEYKAVLISGSGTAALEMAVSSFLPPGKKLLTIRNGVYGERIAKIATIHGQQSVCLDSEWGTPPDLNELENVLKQDGSIDGISMVHHETTTGLLNPLEQVSELATRYKKPLLVDTISSLGGDTIDFDKVSIDVLVGTANKCIHGIPGVSFVLAKNSALEKIRDNPPQSLYMDLHGNFLAQEKKATLFTPAIQAHYALDQALDELITEGVVNRVEHYKQTASFLRKQFVDMGLEILVSESFRSNCLTALKLPQGMSYDTLHDQLREAGFVIYAGQGNLSKTIFRIANMGTVHKNEWDQLISSLKQILKKG